MCLNTHLTLDDFKSLPCVPNTRHLKQPPQVVDVSRYLRRIYHTFAKVQPTTSCYLMTHAQKVSIKDSVTLQVNWNHDVYRRSWVGGAHFPSVEVTFVCCLTHHNR